MLSEYGSRAGQRHFALEKLRKLIQGIFRPGMPQNDLNSCYKLVVRKGEEYVPHPDQPFLRCSLLLSIYSRSCGLRVAPTVRGGGGCPECQLGPSVQGLNSCAVRW